MRVDAPHDWCGRRPSRRYAACSALRTRACCSSRRRRGVVGSLGAAGPVHRREMSPRRRSRGWNEIGMWPSRGAESRRHTKSHFYYSYVKMRHKNTSSRCIFAASEPFSADGLHLARSPSGKKWGDPFRRRISRGIQWCQAFVLKWKSSGRKEASKCKIVLEYVFFDEATVNRQHF